MHDYLSVHLGADRAILAEDKAMATQSGAFNQPACEYGAHRLLRSCARLQAATMCRSGIPRARIRPGRGGGSPARPAILLKGLAVRQRSFYGTAASPPPTSACGHVEWAIRHAEGLRRPGCFERLRSEF